MQRKGGLECKTIEKWTLDSVDAESKCDSTQLSYDC